ncbi:MAG TPA: pyruvate kinase [Longimicrobiales bacterium]|nr:pyruvate kinase [Longimicrobiales bacterium]
MLTKVVATIGPASAGAASLLELVRAGVNVVRINCAHGTREDHRATVEHARAAGRELGRPVAVLVDLAGPKIRTGDFPEPRTLEEGQEVVLAPQADASGEDIPTTYAGLAGDVRPGSRILMDDGAMELEVLETEPPLVRARVLRGGDLGKHKGINLPGIRVAAPSLTEKDLTDIEWAIAAGVEYVGLSFVQRPDDVRDLRARLPPEILIVAKIEKDVALENVEAILEETDAVMVARGDLGVELPFEQVPLAQKRIVQLANLHGRPVITATQMLESMISASRPTRAEASDVANALFDGTDAVMLSGETAVGHDPRLAVEAMVRIAAEIERSHAFTEGPKYDIPVLGHLRTGATPTEHAIAAATVEALRLLGAPAVVTLTTSGATARLVSSYRPPVPILAVCELETTYRQLALVWGVDPVWVPDDHSYDAMMRVAREALVAKEIARPGDRVIVTAGIPFNVPGTTNMMRVEVV